MELGVEVGGERVPVFSFADDTVLAAPSLGNMACLLQEVESYFDSHGLAVNPGKCMGLFQERAYRNNICKGGNRGKVQMEGRYNPPTGL